MGSLSSTPTLPVTYYRQSPEQILLPQKPQSIAKSPTLSSGQYNQDNSTKSNDLNTKKDVKETATKARVKTLLTRKRGRFGTIATSLRGFLGETKTDNVRKTLLGE